MGSPTIFQGQFARLLAQRGLLKRNGALIDADGFITNGHFEVNATGWATYADAAGASPVDGTGGAPTVTFVRSTASPLNGLASGLFTKDAANRQGEGTSFDFTLPTGYTSQTLTIRAQTAAGAGYVSGDLRVYVYDVTNTTVITPSTTAIDTSGKIRVTFVATTSTSYRLIFHVATTSATAYTFKFDDVSIDLLDFVTADPIIVRVARTTANQTIPDATVTTISYDTETVDTHAAFDAGVTDLFTAPRTANYAVAAHIEWAATAFTAGTVLEMRIDKNSGTEVSYSTFIGTGTASARAGNTIVDVVPLTVGQTLRIRVFQNNGANAFLFGTATPTAVWLSIHSLD
jgi:hypothetical protein